MGLPDRDIKLAQIFLHHSLKLKPKEKVLITTSDVTNPLAKACFIESLKLGAYPILDLTPTSDFDYQFYNLANLWQLRHIPKKFMEAKIRWANAYIGISTPDNVKALSQTDPRKITQRSKLVRPIFDRMIDSDRWILTYYPTASQAQEAGVSLDWLTEFYYSACIVDYQKMKNDLTGLERVLDKGRVIQVSGDQTSLAIGCEGRLAKACFGERNIPDGEVFLAPVVNRTEGYIYFEFPTIYAGREIKGVYLEFKKGRVVKAQAQVGQKDLESLLQTDQGARYLGEFAIGANFKITQPLKNTLFDEKIGGTIHLALGRSYKEQRGGSPSNPNKSAIHWDIVKDMRIKGSKVMVDGKVVLKDGKLK